LSTGTLGVAPAEAGVAAAMVNTSQQIGGSVGTALLSSIFASAVSGYLVSHRATPRALMGVTGSVPRRTPAP
jgi:hypothetical protein